MNGLPNRVEEGNLTLDMLSRSGETDRLGLESQALGIYDNRHEYSIGELAAPGNVMSAILFLRNLSYMNDDAFSFCQDLNDFK